MLVHIFIELISMSLSWDEIRYRTFDPAPSSVSGLQLLSNDGGARRGQLVPAAGAAADSPDQKGLVGDKGQVKELAWRKKPLPRTSHGTVPGLARSPPTVVPGLRPGGVHNKVTAKHYNLPKNYCEYRKTLPWEHIIDCWGVKVFFLKIKYVTMTITIITATTVLARKKWNTKLCKKFWDFFFFW